MTSKLVTLAVGICLLSLNAQAKHYCAEDGDCAALGDLVCTKSQCDWGICGCPRGQVAKFVGSDMKFRCITLRKIGQSCSTSGTGGICGPDNSECVDKICRCAPDGIIPRVPIWDGERCYGAGENAYPGETCDSASGCSAGQCGVVDSDLSDGLEGLAGTCSCITGQKVVLSNDLGNNVFLGRMTPTCVDNVFGDFCLTNDDCSRDTSLKCDTSDRKCVCADDTHKETYNGFCAADSGNGFNVVCDDQAEACNPTKNLVCGNVCELDPDESDRCACAPGYKQDGDECIAVELNAECVGDYNCKSLGPNAVCKNGQCTSGSITILGSTGLITLGFILSRWF